MLISEGYKGINTELHRSDKTYGCSGYKFKPLVLNLVEAYGSKDVLDYGCGKATLSISVSDTLNITNYDPAIPAFSSRPRPHDLVVCTDVMEHIEPNFVNNVLDDIKSLTKVAAFITIASRPAQKTLSDGRNAHLIQEHYSWWLPRIWERFNINQFVNQGNKEYLIVVEPKRTNGTHN